MRTYPIKFNPILKEKIWGGQKLTSRYRKGVHDGPVGESWEISGVNDNISKVGNGYYQGMSLKELQRNFTTDFLGSRNYERFGDDFPLLIKFLDASKDLSIQVHPDDEMARRIHGGYGKTEMWYVMDHDEEASVIMGMNEEAEQLPLSGLESSKVESLFNRQKVKKGQMFSIPAGMVHALGAGTVVAEIQQTSDITYRIYDWDRKGPDGNTRELHTALARQAVKDPEGAGRIDFKTRINKPAKAVSNTFFTTSVLDIEHKYLRNLRDLDSFVIYMCVEGRASVTVDNYTEILNAGETVLLPANSNEAMFYAPKARLLEVYVDSTMASPIAQAA